MMLTHVDRKCVAQEGARLVIRMFSFVVLLSSDAIASSDQVYVPAHADTYLIQLCWRGKLSSKVCFFLKIIFFRLMFGLRF